MSDNSNSDDSAKFQAFYYIRSKIPYSPVFGFRLRFRFRYYFGPAEPVQICVLQRRDRFLKRIDASAAGVAYSGPAYDSPSSKDVTEVEYASEWYSE